MKAKILFVILGIILPIFAYPSIISAHPGRTASDGCHYCRTNCASWGEVQGARHCHGGGSTAPIILNPPTPIPTSIPTNTPTPKPTSTPMPTSIPTPEPTSTATPTPNETSIPISTPTLSPEVRGEKTENIQGAEESGDSSSGMLLPLGALGLAGGYWFYKAKLKKRK